MTRLFILMIFTCCTSIVMAQEDMNAQNTWNVELGVIGGWVSYEYALANQFTIQGELGYEGGFFNSSFLDAFGNRNKVNYVFTPTLSLEPKYYYNLNKRNEKGKNTALNSANYISLDIAFTSDWLTSTNASNISVNKSVSIVPKFGIRRNITHGLMFRFAVGLGYVVGENQYRDAILALDLRLGYSF